ncbi:MAG: DUF4423 domain-containing protein [Thermofilaceae archaeon]|nr:DUF4423 domain-containing protein [Thermofilaceae archaeon]
MDKRLIREALKVMGEEPFTPASLARRLKISPGEAESIVGALLAHGFLKLVKSDLCMECPLKASCGANQLTGALVYELTEKGRKLVSGDPDPL